MNESVAAWVEKGTILKSGLEDVAEEIRRAFVLEFSSNYYKQRRKWPNLVFGVMTPILNNALKEGTGEKDPMSHGPQLYYRVLNLIRL